ncbi:MAG: hypothetical protein DSO07_08220 [Thermoproteota archaeon]|uniref:PIN domain-containing protein n=1 Tax=Candidatus Methanodesulfokora washburnensis TaxID=2478471 RepID=A0A3R9X0W2_9CREN|nr:hypothetical protein [Candidatus Methanodesulfokores washburnensis]RSN72534.1 hypothetical protein D6D85_13460 [Candidatus Methanodesulfokores washburnensis]TDA40738.1 MAG: hypothetical protein DSO07_08220 [Candidatus Korarchaeota archaeon]
MHCIVLDTSFFLDLLEQKESISRFSDFLQSEERVIVQLLRDEVKKGNIEEFERRAKRIMPRSLLYKFKLSIRLKGYEDIRKRMCTETEDREVLIKIRRFFELGEDIGDIYKELKSDAFLLIAAYWKTKGCKGVTILTKDSDAKDRIESALKNMREHEWANKIRVST